MASFFTPASQKPKVETRVNWSERAVNDDTPATLLVARYETSRKYGTEERHADRKKIAVFDLDATLITTASGKKHGSEATDWKWWDPTVPAKVRSVYEDGYRVVILSNQAGITLHPDPKTKGPKAPKRLPQWKQKVTAILSQLDIPTCVYAATGKDIFRKPRTGMWKELCEDYDLAEQDIEKEASYFVGDAGGRIALPATAKTKAVAKDFSCSDRNFAHNVGIRYETPEEFFLGEEPREFRRDFELSSYPAIEASDAVFERKNEQDIVLFCGPPGAGKSTFYWSYLKPLGYERVNQDMLKSKDKCFKAARGYLDDGDSIVIDNTNPDPDTRAQWVKLARDSKVPIRCVWFRTPMSLAEHNNAVRAMNANLNPEKRDYVPAIAFNSFGSRFKQPKTDEGFQDVIEAEFKFRGTKEEYSTWGQYWV